MKMFTRRFYKNFQLIQNEFVGKPTKYLEIGVFLGYTSEWMLDNVLTHPDSRLFGIDPWVWFKPFHKRFPTEKDWQEKVLDRIDALRDKYKDKADFIQGYSHDVLRKPYWPDGYFDIVYIDGHHTIQCVLRDYCYAWPLLKVGGVMIFDDYLQGHSDLVKRAVDVILEGIGERSGIRSRKTKYEVLYKNYQIGIRKVAE
jgi:predicted O-methyltransferase YrrM